jgi:hypothetical protein
MNRRQALQAGVAGLATPLLANYHVAAAEKTYHVGLIGCGWFGKVDLFAL